jgi:fatty acid desaturase
MSSTHSIDLEALEADLDALRDELQEELGEEDLRHLDKIVRWGRACTVLGYGTAWLVPNPISATLIGLGISSRWMMVAHHVLHRGYNHISGGPEHYHSKVFARGWRRLVDWMEWTPPEAWSHEHNTLHHYKLGEVHDPDQPEENLQFISSLPGPLKYVVLGLGMATWRALYYPPNALRMLHVAQQRRDGVDEPEERSIWDWRVWVPWEQPGEQLWKRSWVPYVAFHFGAIPLPFLLLGPWSYASVLVNRMMAELFANVHTFMVIVPNHAGEDLYRFDEPIEGRGDFYLRQIVGSTNYRTGGDLNDFLHGWLNYQIEHHLWPNMTMLQYSKAQPRVEAICEEHGVPYVQESIFARFRKLVRIATGKDKMKTWKPEEHLRSAAGGPANPGAAAE